MQMPRTLAALAAGLIVSAFASNASAFCGFYVGGAGADLFNDASQVVLMRDGTKTILSMQNRYDGPVDNFAMVIPVPQVLMEANVKTLDDSVFAKLDTLSAPRLVEYFEDDPCYTYEEQNDAFAGNSQDAGASANNGTTGVAVEAQFTVGEYEIVVLSATESTGLETWLTDNNYSLPAGAAPYYQPYIDAGMYFFIARVDSTKVTFDNGRAVLSPLRFDYDSPTFSLPIRLGMINSAGQQDIIIHTLGRAQRYEAANYGNVTIPTNLELAAAAESTFPTFYKTLFARTIAQNTDAIVTEYAWQASNCDPCPGPTVDSSDLLTLGADILGNDAEYDFSWVLTRLHARFAKDEVGEDIVFAAVDPIVGGREFVIGDDGKLEEGSQPSESNAFQGRYIIRHPWQGEINCTDPQMGRWGSSTSDSAKGPTSTGDDLSVDGNYDLANNLVDDIPELGVEGAAERAERSPHTPGAGTNSGGTNGGTNAGGTTGGPSGVNLDETQVGGGGCSTAGGAGSFGLFGLFAFGWMRRRRRSDRG